MDDVDMRSPFKSPTGNGIHQFDSPFRPRVRRSGSSERSLDNISDENEPPAGMPSSSSNTHGDELQRVNPFEKDVLAGLQKSFWSPSIMEINETPPQRSWAIEHMSHLFPKDIENSPTTHQNSFPVDEQTEAKAQADIATYFNRSQIAPTPSPMKGKGSQSLHCVEVTRKTSVSYAHCASPIARSGGVNSGLTKTNNLGLKKKKVTPVVEKWTQTALSLPVDLPPEIEELLSQYMSKDGEMCGSFSEPVSHCSQKSEASEHTDIVDNDSGKNSSSLNNSIRRRLELSFGDDPDGEDSNIGVPPPMASPITDPFRRNHLMSTPPYVVLTAEIDTTTSELEVQLMRCEFTPETRGLNFAATPGITPITDEPDEKRYENSCSTPKRANGSFKRLTGNLNSTDDPMSPMVDYASVGGSTNGLNNFVLGVSNELRANLRRSRTGSSEGPSRKLSAASSFDDSQLLMDDSSPPAKLYRRHSDKTTS